MDHVPKDRVSILLKHWTTAELETLTHAELLQVGAAFGLLCHGLPDSSIIYEILIRQGEILGRAVTPLEVRMFLVEKAVNTVETAFVELAGAWAETTRYLILPGWVRRIAERFRRKYGVKPILTMANYVAKEEAEYERKRLSKIKRIEAHRKANEQQEFLARRQREMAERFREELADKDGRKKNG